MSILERVYFFHQELKKNRYPNTTALVEHFELSRATARRDIAYLRDRLLAPIAFDQQRNGFYYTENDFSLPFEQSPQILFILGLLGKLGEESGLGDLDEVKKLESRLGSLLVPEYSRLVEAIHCEWVEIEAIDRKIFKTIIEAVVNSTLVQISYRSAQGKESRREVEPLQLVNYQGRWYLLAFCRLRENFRLFHMARIGRMVTLKQKTNKSIEDCKTYLDGVFGIFKGKILYTAEILFTKTAAELVRHQHWHKDQEMIEDDKGLILRLPVSDDREIIMKILQYGSMAKVLAPRDLLERVKEEISAMTSSYKNE